jgi:hypothetical protein
MLALSYLVIITWLTILCRSFYTNVMMHDTTFYVKISSLFEATKYLSWLMFLAH